MYDLSLSSALFIKRGGVLCIPASSHNCIVMTWGLNSFSWPAISLPSFELVVVSLRKLTGLCCCCWGHHEVHWCHYTSEKKIALYSAWSHYTFAIFIPLSVCGSREEWGVWHLTSLSSPLPTPQWHFPPVWCREQGRRGEEKWDIDSPAVPSDGFKGLF